MRKYLTIGVAGVLGVAVLSGSAIAGQDAITDAKNKFPKGSDARDCDADTTVAGVTVPDPGTDQVVFHGAQTLWPPNHKYRKIEITADGDSATEATELTTAVASPENGLGDGNTENDATPESVTSEDADDGSTDGNAGPNVHYLRSERSGLDPEGRTYAIVATATFDNGTDECTETFTVTVPHDMGK